jgi:serine/threonine kinase PknH
VPVAALPGLLLDPAALNTIMGGTAMVLQPEAHPDVMWAAGSIDPPECLAVYHPAEQPVYQGSGWTAVQGQFVREPGDLRHAVVQAVISFPTARAATRFVATQAQGWPACNGKPLTATFPQGREMWTVTTVTNHNGTLTAQLDQEGAGGWECRRAVTARGNVVIDVDACGYALADQAEAIATKITGRVSTQ